jgi:Tfp pilus assembly protein PilX
MKRNAEIGVFTKSSNLEENEMGSPHRSLARTQEGYVAIFAALLMLVLVSIIGFAASRQAVTELAMARNEIVYHRNFYLAEGAALEAADTLENIADLRKDMPSWVETAVGALDAGAVREYFKAPADRDTGVVNSPVSAVKSRLDEDHLQYIGAIEGIAPGESLAVDKPKIHTFSLYGRCEQDGESIVTIGYRAIF